MTDQDKPGAAIEAQDRQAVATLDDADSIVIPTPVAGMNITFRKGQLTLDAEQMRLLAPLRIDSDYDPGQVMVWLLDARARGFNPWARETFLYKIGNEYIRHVGIEGLRKKAEDTHEYRGQTAPEFAGPDGRWTDLWLRGDVPPIAARVGIYRKGFAAPVYRPVYWEEYCPLIDEEVWEGRGRDRKKVRTGQRVPAANWKPASRGGKPLVMFAKCAEAAAFRAAFPNQFQGYYVPEETEKLKYDRQAEAEADAADERRKAAYAKATGQSAPAAPQANPRVMDGEFRDITPPAPGHATVADRELALAELAMQAMVLDRDVPWMTKRWSAARMGRTFDTATPDEVVEHVVRFRPYVIEALRGQQREAEADSYQAAGNGLGTVADLLGGRVEPDPTDEPAEPPAEAPAEENA